ncbi:MAG: NUDIX domain-containing protein [Kangiellaceae bacterium]|nr:NUDIX domain-containing protein [Kangiellaceae bacterium]MCW8998755.1 NUDIX domain-containing protein [Kangiellaceae bacterium]MCW9016035.1 NUDIX domain-containing protein [Kangiellaceae bacterium]
MDYSVRIVSGVIIQNDHVLLCLRKNTKDYSAHWAFPVGHIEDNENEQDALRRELYEELGIQVIDSVKITTLYDNELSIEHTVYHVSEWRGELINREPHLCEQIKWFLLDQMPSPLTPPTMTIMESLQC